jgi:hypothetical protein
MTNIYRKVMIKDLDKLRTVVKTQHMKNYPETHINDYEADKIIDALSDEVKEKLIKLAVDHGITEL